MTVRFDQLPQDLTGFHFSANWRSGSVVVWNAKEFWPGQELCTLRLLDRDERCGRVADLLDRGAKFVVDRDAAHLLDELFGDMSRDQQQELLGLIPAEDLEE